MRNAIILGGAVVLAGIAGALSLRSGTAINSAQALTPPALETRLVGVAQDALRQRLRAAEQPRFGETTVFRFGPEDERAVCGRVQPAGGAETGFVMRILLPRNLAAENPRFVTVLEQGPGLPNIGTLGADRYCHDADAQPAAAPTTPPADAEPAAPAEPPAAAAPTAETVQIRSAANVRATPGGGGEVLRVAPQGATLAVFGRAPGGWYQVGDTAPQGWVHGSMVVGGP